MRRGFAQNDPLCGRPRIMGQVLCQRALVGRLGCRAAASPQFLHKACNLAQVWPAPIPTLGPLSNPTPPLIASRCRDQHPTSRLPPSGPAPCLPHSPRSARPEPGGPRLRAVGRLRGAGIRPGRQLHALGLGATAPGDDRQAPAHDRGRFARLVAALRRCRTQCAGGRSAGQQPHTGTGRGEPAPATLRQRRGRCQLPARIQRRRAHPAGRFGHGFIFPRQHRHALGPGPVRRARGAQAFGRSPAAERTGAAAGGARGR